MKRADPDVIGVGEHTHGELISWVKRLEVVERWVLQGHRVLVLTDHMDYFVQGMRDQDVHFDMRRVFVNGKATCAFWPTLMPFSEYTREHLEIMRRFAAFDRDSVTFYGIDVRLLDHPHLLSGTRSSVLKDLLKRQRSTWVRARGDGDGEQGSTGDDVRSAERSRFNAGTVLSMARMHPGYKIAYFAHNENVAFDCDAMRSPSADSLYLTEGAILRWSLGDRYSSIGTFAPTMYNTFWNKLSCALQTLLHSKRMGYCSKKDFDSFFSYKESRLMTPLCCGNNQLSDVGDNERLDALSGKARAGLSFDAIHAKLDSKEDKDKKKKCKKKKKVSKCQKLARLASMSKSKPKS